MTTANVTVLKNNVFQNNVGNTTGTAHSDSTNNIFGGTSVKFVNEAGFDFIEWVLDLSKNPILEDTGRNEMELLSDEYNIGIKSVCCDYFMENKL